jgi:hypothetical protein
MDKTGVWAAFVSLCLGVFLRWVGGNSKLKTDMGGWAAIPNSEFKIPNSDKRQSRPRK